MSNLAVAEFAEIDGVKKFFTTGLNVAKCEFDEYLFEHYAGYNTEEDGDIDSGWIQLVVSNIEAPDAKYYVQEGMLVFYNKDTKEYLVAGGHQLVVQADDVEFLSVPTELQEQLIGECL